MTSEPNQVRIFTLFAKLLDYPWTPLTGVARECAELVAESSPRAAAYLQEFEAFVNRTPHSRLEEIYTSAFELNAACHPYIGYHLFGESYKRSIFLLGLKERYRLYNIDCGVELPDHLAVMLRFLAVNQDVAETDGVIREALHPALCKMLKDKVADAPGPGTLKQPGRDGEYKRLLHALRAVLLTYIPDEAPPEGEMPLDDLLPVTGS